MKSEILIGGFPTYRMQEFADMHGITWQAVNYLVKRGKVDSKDVRGTTYIVMTPKTKRYQPNDRRVD